MENETGQIAYRYRHLLLNEFAHKRQKNSQFSVRAFAKYLGVDHSNLSKILKGHKEVGEKYILKISSKLNLSESDLIALKKDNRNFKDLTIDVFLVVSNWYYDAILEMTKLKDFTPNVKIIAQKLKLSETQVKEAVQRLEALGLLEIEDKKWIDTSEYNSFVTNTVTSSAQRNYQKEILEKAIDAIDNVPRTERCQSSVTMAISKKQLSKAQEEIKRFRRNMSEILEESGDDKDDVYQLSVSLFPLLN